MDPEGGRRLAAGAMFAGHRIEYEIGRGGMGVVYRAHHLALELDRALKLIAPALSADRGFRERFRREARVAASIDHPNVIPGYDAGEEDGVLYLSMRLVEGADLRRIVARQGPLPLQRVARLIGGVASALDAAHAHGLVHRDVKPANILVESTSEREHVFLTDFGISRIATAGTARTSSGELLGSVDYVAPEQIEGRPGDRRVDVYALGGVLHFALTGRPPFPLDTDLAKLYAHAHAPRPRPSELVAGLSADLDDVVARAMATQSDGRYATAGELADDLRRVASGRALTPAREGLAAKAATSPRARRRRKAGIVLAAIAAVAAAAVLTAVLLLDGSVDERAQPSAGPTPRQPHPAATIRVGDDPVALTVGNVVWVASRSQGVVDAIDTASGRLAGSPIRIGGAPVSVTTGFGSVWAVDTTANALVRLDPAREAAPVSIPVGERPTDVAIDKRWLWVTNEGANTVSRVDPATNQADATIPVGQGPSSVATGAGAVWVTNIDGKSVSEIDPRRARVTGKPIFVGQRPNDVAVGGGRVWVIDVFNGTLSSIDPLTGIVGKPIEVGPRPRGVKTGFGYVWVANGGDGTVSRIDPRAGAPAGKPIPVGTNPADIAVGRGAVWTANSDDATVTKIRP
jgi:YVTN family beta-propeller protein